MHRIGRKLTVVFSLFLIATGALAAPVQAAEPVNQKTFISGSNQHIPDSGEIGSVLSDITVSGLTGNVTDVDVLLHLNHTPVGDLDGAVTSPIYDPNVGSGFSYLFSGVGGSGGGFGNDCYTEYTLFDDEATDPIDSGTAPFVGAFQPSPNVPGGAQPLSNFDGMTPGERLQGLR